VGLLVGWVGERERARASASASERASEREREREEKERRSVTGRTWREGDRGVGVRKLVDKRILEYD
jgi:hypothetical protein